MREPRPYGAHIAVKLLRSRLSPEEILSAARGLKALEEATRTGVYRDAMMDLFFYLGEVMGALTTLKSPEGLGWLGMEFDHETGRAQVYRRSPEGKKKNARDFYNDLICDQAETIAWHDTGQPPEPKDQGLREKVAHELRGVVPADHLDTSADGNVYHLIRNRNVKRDKLVREIEECELSEEAIEELLKELTGWHRQPPKADPPPRAAEDGGPQHTAWHVPWSLCFYMIKRGAWRSAWLRHLEVLSELVKSDAVSEALALIARGRRNL